jgi:hypothetical protein
MHTGSQFGRHRLTGPSRIIILRPVGIILRPIGATLLMAALFLVDFAIPAAGTDLWACGESLLKGLRHFARDADSVQTLTVKVYSLMARHQLLWEKALRFNFK